MKKIVITFGLFLVALNLWGVPILGSPETWESGFGGWTYEQIDGDAASPSLDNVTSALRINLSGNVDDDPVSGRVYADSTSGSPAGRFVGDLLSGGSDLTVSFSLKAVDSANPNGGSLVLYFINEGNKYVYEAAQSALVGSFVNYSFNIGSLLWNPTGADNFLADFASVDQFGIELIGSSGGLRRYDLDNFQFTVPEPETVWMILIVLASLGLTFRGRLSEIAGMIKARIRA
jgi:hypothetical protein